MTRNIQSPKIAKVCPYTVMLIFSKLDIQKTRLDLCILATGGEGIFFSMHLCCAFMRSLSTAPRTDREHTVLLIAKDTLELSVSRILEMFGFVRESLLGEHRLVEADLW